MITTTKRLSEKTDTIQEFTLLLWENRIMIGSSRLPLGQCSTDILNLKDDFFIDLKRKRDALAKVIYTQFYNRKVKKDLAVVCEIQNILNEVLDDIMTMAPYRYLNIDKKFGQTMLVDLFKNQPKIFKEMLNRQTRESDAMFVYFFKIITIADDALTFRTYMTIMIDAFFEGLNKRNPEHYAIGVYKFFSSYEAQKGISDMLPDDPAYSFKQANEIRFEYTTMPNPDDKKIYIIAERIVFNSLISFLNVDFFRGLIHGHTPRRCHNCGTYFLLLSGHNTCYCSNLAPNKKPTDKNNTCRDIGAHIKETDKKEKRTPAQQEYDKVYNRLKTRKNRRKISNNEWNEQVALALSYMEQNESGKLSDFEYREIMRKL